MIQQNRSTVTIWQTPIFNLDKSQNQRHIKIVEILFKHVLVGQALEIFKVGYQLGIAFQIFFQMFRVRKQVVKVLQIIFLISYLLLNESQFLLFFSFRELRVLYLMTEISQPGQNRLPFTLRPTFKVSRPARKFLFNFFIKSLPLLFHQAVESFQYLFRKFYLFNKRWNSEKLEKRLSAHGLANNR